MFPNNPSAVMDNRRKNSRRLTSNRVSVTPMAKVAVNQSESSLDEFMQVVN